LRVEVYNYRSQMLGFVLFLIAIYLIWKLLPVLLPIGFLLGIVVYESRTRIESFLKVIFLVVAIAGLLKVFWLIFSEYYDQYRLWGCWHPARWHKLCAWWWNEKMEPPMTREVYQNCRDHFDDYDPLFFENLYEQYCTDYYKDYYKATHCWRKKPIWKKTPENDT